MYLNIFKKIYSQSKTFQINDALALINLLSGNLVFRTEVKSKLWKLHHRLMFINYVMSFGETVYFLTHSKDLLSIIYFSNFLLLNFGGSKIKLINTFLPLLVFVLAFQLFAFCLTYILTHEKKNVVQVLAWVNDLSRRQTPFGNDKFNETITKAKDYARKMMLFFILIFITIFFAVCFISPFVVYLIFDRKFPLPYELHIPYLEPINWTFYIINFSHQLYTVSTIVFLMIMTFSSVSLGLIYVIAHFEGIKYLVECMEPKTLTGEFDQWLKVVAIQMQDVKM